MRNVFVVAISAFFLAIAAGSASAAVSVSDVEMCVDFVAKYYPVGPHTTLACEHGANGDKARCVSILRSRQVVAVVANEACRRAGIR